MSTPVLRFAPSPNGPLHLGHAYSALLNDRMARESGGTLLLRFEDIDTTRCKPEFEDAICEDLEWLGVRWKGEPLRQSDHFAEYALALDRLAEGGFLYATVASRAQINQEIAQQESSGGKHWPRDPDGTPIYPFARNDRPFPVKPGNLPLGERSLRLKTDKLAAGMRMLAWTETGEGPNGETGTVIARPRDWGDVIIARKDTPTSYHLSVVIDDGLQGVTHVVRGRDLFASTSIHRVLQGFFDMPAPVYHHHRLILGMDGEKLSKSSQSTSLKALRDNGSTPEDIRRMIAFHD